MFSILILTYNEEINLPECLQSVSWCDDIVVLDSGSTDDTVEIAKNAGCRVYVRKFENFAEQRNYGISKINYKYSWIFHLDADERFTEALRRECNIVVQKDKQSGYFVPSKMILWNRWIKHAAAFPVYQMRFHKLGEVYFEQFGHGQRERSAKRGIGVLSEAYEHHSYSKGLSEWFDRHNRYSSQEAAETFRRIAERVPFSQLFSHNPLIRRRALKLLSFKLPGRAACKFLYLYFLRAGFLDGRVGLAYCLMQSIYEQMIVLKLAELRHIHAKGNTVLRPCQKS